MIIFGTRAKILTPKSPVYFDCPYCHSKGTVSFGYAARYFHIFWIPIFPISKKGISQCSHCKQVVYEKDMNPEMQQACRSAAASAQRPVTHYLGLILIGILFLFGLISTYNSSKNEAKYLADPHIGDTYRIENSEGYTLYKVADVKGDTIVFHPHNKILKKYIGITELQRKYRNDYADETLKFTKAQIKAMSNDAKSSFGRLYGIDRD